MRGKKSYSDPRIFILLLALLLLSIAPVEAQTFSISASSAATNSVTLTPNLNTGGKSFLSIVYGGLGHRFGLWVNHTNAHTTIVPSGCGSKSVNATATFSDGSFVAAASVTVDVLCPLTVSFTPHGGNPDPTPKVIGGRIYMHVTTNRLASATCYLTDPKHAVETVLQANSVSCPPDTLVSLDLPDGYTCGPVKTKAEAVLSSNSAETAETSGVATNNLCPLAPALALDYDYSSSKLKISATTQRQDATLTCWVNNSGATFPCGVNTLVDQSAGATYTVVATAKHGDETASATVTLVVPPAPGPAATATPDTSSQASFTISATSPGPNKLRITPNIVLGGNMLWGISYFVVDESALGVYGDSNAREFDVDWCGRRTVQASLTWEVDGGPSGGLTAADVTVDVICPLQIRWAIHGGNLQPRFANGNVFFAVSTSKPASAVCYLVSPKNASDNDNEVACPPGTLVSLEPPSSYTCGPISVKAKGTTVGDENDTHEITGVVTNNPCEADANATATQVETEKAVSLTVQLAVSYDYTRRQLLISPISSRAGAFLKCTIDGGEAFSCPTTAATYRSVDPNATYTVVVNAAHGGDTASATAVLVVPAAPGPAATATPTPPLSLTNVAYDAAQKKVTFQTQSTSATGAYECDVVYLLARDGDPVSCPPGATTYSLNVDVRICSDKGNLKVRLVRTAGAETETVLHSFSKPCPDLDVSFASLYYAASRLYAKVDTNILGASATCRLNTEAWNECAPGTLVNLSVNAGETYTMQASASFEDQSASFIAPMFFISADGNSAVTETPVPDPVVGFSNVVYDETTNEVSFTTTSNIPAASFTCEVGYSGTRVLGASMAPIGNAFLCPPGGGPYRAGTADFCSNQEKLIIRVTASGGEITKIAEHAIAKTCPPLLAWFDEDNTGFSPAISRIFLFFRVNRGTGASGTCIVNGGEINCVPNTQVSLNVYAGGKYSIKGIATFEDESVTIEYGDFIIAADGESAMVTPGATATPTATPTDTPVGPHVQWPLFYQRGTREWAFRAAASEGDIEVLTYDYGDGTREAYTSEFDQTMYKSYARTIGGEVIISAEIALHSDELLTGSRSIMLPPVARAPRPTSPASEASPSPAPTESAPRSSCAKLPANIEVKATYGITSGIECNHFKPELTGVDDALDAVDLWAYVEQGAEICIQGGGRLLFLDAAYAPRRRMALPSYVKNGMTCAEVNRPGTIVRAPGSPTVLQTPTITPSAAFFPPGFRTPSPTADLRTPTITPSPGLAQAGQLKPLFNCVVNSLFILNFRAAPWGTILGWFNGAGTALARTPGWYQIVYNGQIGWVSADPTLTVGLGDCA